MVKNLKMTYDGVRAATDAIRSLSGMEVLVGIPAEKALRDPEVDAPSPVNNAMLGYIHEFGSPAKNIPPRPFLLPGIDEAKDKLGNQLEGGVRAIFDGKTVEAEQIMHRVGLTAADSVRKRLNDGPHAPLKPATLARRRARGFKGTKPLIETTQLRNSITYVVK